LRVWSVTTISKTANHTLTIMRHGKKHNHLGRTHSHRVAMLENMASSLILHKRVETTIAKAKELRKFVEPILTRAKEDTYQNRRIAFMSLNDKETMKELFGVVADKIANRPGGYTRIIKLGNRAGDNAETCLIELVDFNEVPRKQQRLSKPVGAAGAVVRARQLKAQQQLQLLLRTLRRRGAKQSLHHKIRKTLQ